MILMCNSILTDITGTEQPIIIHPKGKTMDNYCRERARKHKIWKEA
jgi:hypothetical protein